jgi:hypothetical protein
MKSLFNYCDSTIESYNSCEYLGREAFFVSGYPRNAVTPENGHG